MARAGGIGIALTVLVLAAAAPDSEARTRVIRYTPFDSAGEPKRGLRAVRRSGTCRFSSLLALREDAWRCRTGRRRRDPCFDNPVFEDAVGCVRAPWSRTVVLIDTPLDDTDRVERTGTRPWAIRLRRRRCLFVRSRRVVRRRRLNYRCGRRGPYLFGVPNRRRATWTIRVARKRDGRRMRRVRIRTAWR
jgi:hypothetical protein